MVIYARISRWDQRSFAATLQPIFMTMGALSVVMKLWTGGGGGFPRGRSLVSRVSGLSCGGNSGRAGDRTFIVPLCFRSLSTTNGHDAGGTRRDQRDRARGVSAFVLDLSPDLHVENKHNMQKNEDKKFSLTLQASCVILFMSLRLGRHDAKEPAMSAVKVSQKNSSYLPSKRPFVVVTFTF